MKPAHAGEVVKDAIGQVGELVVVKEQANHVGQPVKDAIGQVGELIVV